MEPQKPEYLAAYEKRSGQSLDQNSLYNVSNFAGNLSIKQAVPDPKKKLDMEERWLSKTSGWLT